MSNQKAFMDDLAKRVHIKDREGWFHVTHDAVIQHGGGALLKYYGSMKKLLQSVYPEYHVQEMIHNSACSRELQCMVIREDMSFISFFKFPHLLVRKLEERDERHVFTDNHEYFPS